MAAYGSDSATSSPDLTSLITKTTIWIHLVRQVVPAVTIWATGLGLYGGPQMTSLVLQQMPPHLQLATLNLCLLMKAWDSFFHPH